VVARGSHDTDRSLDAAQLALNRKWQPPVGYESRVWSCRGEMLLRARSTHPPVGTLRCARGRSISPRHCALAVDLYGTVLFRGSSSRGPHSSGRPQMRAWCRGIVDPPRSGSIGESCAATRGPSLREDRRSRSRAPQMGGRRACLHDHQPSAPGPGGGVI
jgi:hypothetical protein